MAGYSEYKKADLDLEVPVMLSLRELRVIELLIGGDTFATGSDWELVAERAQDKLADIICERRIVAERNLSK